MSAATHRAGLVALLQAVPDIGRVHAQEVYGRSQAEFEALYAWERGDGTTQLRGWFVRRLRVAERQPGNGRWINAHSWTVRGFMALDTANDSELEFDALIEAVRRAYRADQTLGGVAEPGPLDQLSGFQLTDASPVALAGVLCHSATLALTTYELLDAGE